MIKHPPFSLFHSVTSISISEYLSMCHVNKILHTWTLRMLIVIDVSSVAKPSIITFIQLSTISQNCLKWQCTSSRHSGHDVSWLPRSSLECQCVLTCKGFTFFGILMIG